MERKEEERRGEERRKEERETREGEREREGEEIMLQRERWKKMQIRIPRRRKEDGRRIKERDEKTQGRIGRRGGGGRGG